MTKLLSLLKEAFASDETRDFTSISINRAVVLLAIPMVLEMFFEALFSLVDAFFVARYVGTIGVATVGLTESVLMLIYSLAWGLSAGASAIIARRIGEKDFKNASLSVYQVISIAITFGLLLGVAGFLFADDVLRLMGGEEALVQQGGNYTRISFASAPVILMIFALSGAMRGAGNAVIAMRAVIFANLLNIALDALFVIYFQMGVEGAALATLIGRSCGVAYLFYALLYVDKKLNLRLKDFTIEVEIISKIIKLATGVTGQFIIQSCSWIFLTRILSVYGSEVIAGYTIAIRVIIFTILPSWGLANASATLVGQNLGANKPDRAEASVWRITLFNTIFLVLVAAVLIFNAESIISAFDTTPKVVETGVLCLVTLSSGYIFFGTGMIIPQALNGAGDTLTPTILNFFCFWIIEIPLAYVLSTTFGYAEQGVFLSIIIAESILTVLAIIIFRRGKWKLKQV
jgi:putative MATE family efflux protein